MMVITLNSEPLDVTIENEKRLDELVSGLAEWLHKSGYEITSLVKDGLGIEIYSNDWQETLLTNIKELDIKAISSSSKYISDLQTLYQYITLLHNALVKDNSILIEDLLSELSFITNALDSFLSKKDIPSWGTEKLIDLINSFKDKENGQPGIKKELVQLLYNITLSLQTRIQEVSSPFPELQNTAEKLKDLIPAITDIAVMLQTGDDKHAMESVLDFIALSEKLIRIFPFLIEFGYSDIREISIDDEEFSKFYKDLNEILTELVSAFDINDSILIGDLMEYEIAPRITKLLKYINLIEKVQE